MKNEKKIFYIILAAVLITGLLFSFYAFSKIRSIHALRAVIEETGAERAQAIGKDSDRSAEVRKTLPERIWTTEFIETAYNASRKYGIRDLTFDQKSGGSSHRLTSGNGRPSLQSYPVRMTFRSGYREMADFIQALQGLDKLVTIDSLKIKRQKSYLAVEMTASTYAMEVK